MKTLFGDRRMWVSAIALATFAVLGGCTNPKPHHAPTRTPKPPVSPSNRRPPKTPQKSPAPRFTQDTAGNQLQQLSSTPAGEARLRAWMNANGLQNEAVELFIRADIYAAQRKKAASALAP